MINDDLVSVIIPVYNASKYLRSALKSLIHQTYKNIEIICVDDGSTDNSVEIIEKYIKLDNRIKLIRQKNSFAGVARNNGFQHAKGEYCIFLDADDIFARNMISELVEIITREHTDIVCFGFYYFVITPLVKKNNLLPITDIKISPNDISDILFSYDDGVPWNKFYRTSFIKKIGIEFSPTKRNNDVFFSRLTTVLAESIYFSSKRLLFYRVWNKNSLQGGDYKSPENEYFVIKQIVNELKSRMILNIYYPSTEKMIVGYCCYGDDNYLYSDYVEKYRYSKELIAFLEREMDSVDDYKNYELEIIQSIIEDDFIKYIFLMKSKKYIVEGDTPIFCMNLKRFLKIILKKLS